MHEPGTYNYGRGGDGGRTGILPRIKAELGNRRQLGGRHARRAGVRRVSFVHRGSQATVSTNNHRLSFCRWRPDGALTLSKNRARSRGRLAGRERARIYGNQETGQN